MTGTDDVLTPRSAVDHRVNVYPVPPSEPMGWRAECCACGLSAFSTVGRSNAHDLLDDEHERDRR